MNVQGECDLVLGSVFYTESVCGRENSLQDLLLTWLVARGWVFTLCTKHFEITLKNSPPSLPGGEECAILATANESGLCTLLNLS